MKSLAIACVLCLILLAPQAVAARTWHVRQDGTGDCTTIQACCDAAAAYDTVLVAAGTYAEVLSITKHVTVLSEAGPTATTITTVTSSHIPPVSIWSSTLDGFTIRGVHIFTGECGGVKVDSGTLRNCVIVNCRSAAMDGETLAGGVIAYGSSVIERNTVVSNGYLTVAGGIYCHSSFVGTIRQNIVALSNGYGIYCSTGSSSTFICNDVWGNVPSDYGGACGVPVGINGNICVNPLFCNAQNGDYRLNSGSPCLSAVGCGQIGALGAGCGPTAVAPTTWGRIKAMFR